MHPELSHLSIDHVKNVAYQGVPGAYSHLTCSTLFPDAAAISCQNFDEAFKMVASRNADFAAIPIENSLGGRVSDVHHLLPESGLYIVGEYFLPINHCLWGIKGSRFEDIKEVRSHEQALSQCRVNLNGLGVNAVPTSDTAGAARDLASSKLSHVGVLSSAIAGEIYGLELLRARMEDRLDNVTRFIILSHRPQEPAYDVSHEFLTSLYLDTRSVPAALYKCLGSFATRQINIIRLESYVSLSDQSRSSFYIEIEGHPAQSMIAQALEELQYFSNRVKPLGTYPTSPYRHHLSGGHFQNTATQDGKTG